MDSAFNLVNNPSTPANDLTKILQIVPYRRHTILDLSVNFVLGPHLEEIATETPLNNFLPYHHQEKLLLATPAERWDLSKWIASGQIRSWPVVDDKDMQKKQSEYGTLERPSWEEWCNRLKPEFGDRWISAGIEALIPFSLNKLPMDRGLLLAAACFWSKSCNCFLFPCGPMTPTVLDMVALTGVPGFGTCINPLLQAPHTISFSTQDATTAWGTYMRASIGIKGSPTCVNEHQRFILQLLNRFVFCPTSGQMSSEYREVASFLAAGQSLNLATYLLSTLYRGMSQLGRGLDFKNVGGPLWVLQLWLYFYFPEIAPSHKFSSFLTCYGHQYLGADVIFKPYSFYLKFFSSLTTARQHHLFAPFIERSLGPSWFTNKIPENDVVVKEFIANCLIPRDLPVGGPVSIPGLNPGVETYSPNYVARQFGFIQSIPMPMYAYSWNYPSCRDNCTASIFELLQVAFCLNKEQNKYQTFGDKPHTTPQFDNWWARIYASRVCSDPAMLPRSLVISEYDEEQMLKQKGIKGKAKIAEDEGQAMPSKACASPEDVTFVKEISTVPKRRTRQTTVAVEKAMAENAEVTPRAPKRIRVESTPRVQRSLHTSPKLTVSEETVLTNDNSMDQSSTLGDTSNSPPITSVHSVNTSIPSSLQAESVSSPAKGITSLTLALTDVERMLASLQQAFTGTPTSTPLTASSETIPIPSSQIQLKQNLMDIFSKGYEEVLTGPLLAELSELLKALKSHTLTTDEERTQLAIYEELLVLAPEFQQTYSLKPVMDDFFQQLTDQEVELKTLTASFQDHTLKFTAWKSAKESTSTSLTEVQVKIAELQAREETLKTTLAILCKDDEHVEATLRDTTQKIMSFQERAKNHLTNRSQMEIAKDKLQKISSSVCALWTTAQTYSL